MLFDTTIFGPIHSRRLGTSLGINLLPNHGKICSFDCVYCECGLNADGREDTVLSTPEEVKTKLTAFLQEYKAANKPQIDTFTFAGNGEPTVHPQFLEIVQEVVAIRNEYYPQAKISVLSNAWQLGDPKVAKALHLIDNNILKLDSAFAETIRLMNRPVNPTFSVDVLIDHLASFSPDCVIQTMFLRGHGIDNTTDEEVNAWLAALQKIRPRLVQIYSIDRKVPIEGLHHVDEEELNAIASKVQALGIPTLVTP